MNAPKLSRILRQYVELETLAGTPFDFGEQNLSHVETSSSKEVRAEQLNVLRRKSQTCTECPLHNTRTSVVFGEGSPEARLMFIGEAPGRDEDLQGKPFVGKAGQLLTKIIKAIDLSREEVYIANIIKCRPPNNRNPLPEEITACGTFLKEQISLIQPEVITTLGRFASEVVLKTSQPISRVRGTFHDVNGIKVMATYHPAYLLRNPGDKRLVWEDMKKVRDLLRERT